MAGSITVTLVFFTGYLQVTAEPGVDVRQLTAEVNGQLSVTPSCRLPNRGLADLRTGKLADAGANGKCYFPSVRTEIKS